MRVLLFGCSGGALWGYRAIRAAAFPPGGFPQGVEKYGFQHANNHFIGLPCPFFSTRNLFSSRRALFARSRANGGTGSTISIPAEGAVGGLCLEHGDHCSAGPAHPLSAS
jgi:hypothetical protein